MSNIVIGLLSNRDAGGGPEDKRERTAERIASDVRPQTGDRDVNGEYEMPQFAVAMALYLALIAGLALHGLDMPDPMETSSVSNHVTGLSEAQLDRLDRE